MQRSSPSIAALAAALAKAQIELANPEKSLIGTIEPQRGEGGARQFRYAPLSSGLEIVRKTLGQHEIATVGTTAIDQAAGIVNLTTVLAHSSGEWIASDWPVCAVAETQWRALGRKVSDEFTVPLCRTHHREIHRCGDEGSWWQNTGIDPLAAARTLWLETHPLLAAEAANATAPDGGTAELL
jgi:hypothetical protein